MLTIYFFSTNNTLPYFGYVEMEMTIGQHYDVSQVRELSLLILSAVI